MYLKRYTLGTLALMLFVGWYISQYLGYSQTEAISFFGIHLPSLPVSVLILLPVFVLYLLSVSHMFYYSVKNFFSLRNFKKDYESLIDVIVDELLLVQKIHTFKTDRYKLLGSVLGSTAMVPKGDLILTDNNKVNEALKLIHDINDGKVVDLKKFNLPEDNELVLKNQNNRMQTLDLSPEEILNKSDKYNKDVLEKAYLSYCTSAPMFAIEKYKEYITKEALFIILSRINSEENTLEVSNESLLELISSLVLSKSDYLSISKELSIHMIPEQRTKLFETLSDEYEEAQEAYLYTLFDLEMIDTAKEFLETQRAEDAMKFRAYLALKEAGHNFNISLFL
ncbi:hypothetical protein JHD50_12130 [Sulfurimonas sp. MAG313]|nr:hypothetical protein [Sulfurimonas sp. MAG313]MDF1882037.1 hypothetical protein [Sulfurimonas sp. MAG313]